MQAAWRRSQCNGRRCRRTACMVRGGRAEKLFPEATFILHKQQHFWKTCLRFKPHRWPDRPLLVLRTSDHDVNAPSALLRALLCSTLTPTLILPFP